MSQVFAQEFRREPTILLTNMQNFFACWMPFMARLPSRKFQGVKIFYPFKKKIKDVDIFEKTRSNLAFFNSTLNEVLERKTNMQKFFAC